MFKRLTQAVFSILIAFDTLVQCLIKAPIWIIFARARPSSRETISATLGWGEAHGYRWAAFCARLVDDIFGAGHCARAYQSEAAFEQPL